MIRGLRILEINPGHPLILRLADLAGGDGNADSALTDAALLLLDQARIVERGSGERHPAMTPIAVRQGHGPILNEQDPVNTTLIALTTEAAKLGLVRWNSA